MSVSTCQRRPGRLGHAGTTRGRAVGILVAIVFFSAVDTSAQTPNFSGTWMLDAAKSRSVATAGFVGLISAGAPKTLHITQPANGTVVIESQVNEAHARSYKPGGQTSTPAGQGGAVTMNSRWEGRSLVSEGALKAPNGDTTPIREVITLGPDSNTLNVEVTASTAEKATSALVYTRINDVGPCEGWPTPCKRAG